MYWFTFFVVAEHISTMAAGVLDNPSSIRLDESSVRCVGVRRRAMVEQNCPRLQETARSWDGKSLRKRRDQVIRRINTYWST